MSHQEKQTTPVGSGKAKPRCFHRPVAPAVPTWPVTPVAPDLGSSAGESASGGIASASGGTALAPGGTASTSGVQLWLRDKQHQLLEKQQLFQGHSIRRTASAPGGIGMALGWGTALGGQPQGEHYWLQGHSISVRGAGVHWEITGDSDSSCTEGSKRRL
jgi:hypothetical protein